jgi:hypothetical protein
MSPTKARKQITDSFWQLPWDQDPDIGWALCLEAILKDDTKLAARYLLTSERIDRRITLALADKIEPGLQGFSKYILKRAAGRPRKLSPSRVDDPIESAMEKGDLKWIADYLRREPKLDRRIVEWLAVRLDPPTVDSPRFIVRQKRGRPTRRSRLSTMLHGDTAKIMLGLKVHREFQKGGKLEAALHHFTQANKDWPHPISRSKARRSHDAFLAHTRKP